MKLACPEVDLCSDSARTISHIIIGCSEIGITKNKMLAIIKVIGLEIEQFNINPSGPRRKPRPEAQSHTYAPSMACSHNHTHGMQQRDLHAIITLTVVSYLEAIISHGLGLNLTPPSKCFLCVYDKKRVDKKHCLPWPHPKTWLVEKPGAALECVIHVDGVCIRKHCQLVICSKYNDPILVAIVAEEKRSPLGPVSFQLYV